MHCRRSGWSAVVFSALLAGATVGQPPDVRAVLDHISSQSMRGHVSFLASDLLEGRATPSRGLEVAAEYIAAEFRRAGLEPAGDDGYFQTAKFVSFEPERKSGNLELDWRGKRIPANVDDAAIQIAGPLSIKDAPVVKFAAADASRIEQMKHADVQDKVIAFYLGRGFQGGFRTYAALRRLKPALLVVAGPGVPREKRPGLVAADQRDAEGPIIGVREGAFADAIEQAKSGPTELKLTVNLAAPRERAIVLRNVAGLVRGSDPVLRDSYILLTAHYDHIGMKPDGDGDLIFNGANDDASGTASVMEIASAFAAMQPKPKRSILFVALFGEELGLFGSQYYGRHPLVPLSKTVGDINLEHMGRTDSNEGAKIASASFTGYEYSGLPAIFEKAGAQVGVKVYKDDKRSDAFFARSDNQALADLGIPAHTLCVAFEFPDYHGVGDEWGKLDYENMAKVDRMVALGLWFVADSETPPAWNESQSKAKRYLSAWRALKGQATDPAPQP